MPAPNQVFFLGQPIESLSRAELIEAVRELVAEREELRRDRDRCEQSGSAVWAANQIKDLLDDLERLREERTRLREERMRLQQEELRLLEKRNKKSSSGMISS